MTPSILVIYALRGKTYWLVASTGSVCEAYSSDGAHHADRATREAHIAAFGARLATLSLAQG